MVFEQQVVMFGSFVRLCDVACRVVSLGSRHERFGQQARVLVSKTLWAVRPNRSGSRPSVCGFGQYVGPNGSGSRPDLECSKLWLWAVGPNDSGNRPGCLCLWAVRPNRSGSRPSACGVGQ